MRLKNHIFELTPLGKADKEVREYLEEGLETHQFERYERTLNQYRHMKVFQGSLKILLYASIITSVAATFGLGGQLKIIERLASYLGTSLIFVLYAITSYITMIRRETYHVQREILISQADWSDY